MQDRVGRKLISDENQVVSNGTLTQVGGDLLTDSRYLIGPSVERALTGNNHHLEGINELPPAARLRGLRVTCLKYGE